MRRRGNIMLFVIFILGTLFAASIAFLALMRTDAEIITAEKQEFKFDMIVDGLMDEIMLGNMQAVMSSDATGAAGDDRVPYAQRVLDNDGDGIADNADSLSRWADIPGVHPLLTSIEPYDPGTGVLEYFADVDLYRAWDGGADVRAAGGPIHPRVPVGRPLRIRPLNGTDPAAATYDPFDRTDDAFVTRHGSLADADGDGVVDSRLFRITLLGGGEPDWFNPNPTSGDPGPDGINAMATDDTMVVGSVGTTWPCDGWIDTPDATGFKGAPSFTARPGALPAPTTPLPCDAAAVTNPNQIESGTAFPQALRSQVASVLRDPTEYDPTDLDEARRIDAFNDLYFAVRHIPNGAMVNIWHSHWTLQDNLFGLDSGDAPVAAGLSNLPTGPATEQMLRHRGILSPRKCPNQSGFILDPLSDDCVTNTDPAYNVYRMLFGAMVNNDGDQWTPLEDEPGDAGTYDNDWSARWMNPGTWNDLADSADFGNSTQNYDIHHLVTTVSTDDLFMRNGTYRFIDASGFPQKVLLNDLAGLLYVYNPADGLDLPPNNYGPSGDTALTMYGCDPNYVPNTDPALDIGDRSFYTVDRTVTPPVATANVPLTLQVSAGAYGVPRNTGGDISDPRFARMQFSLHSIGDINNPTQREIQTVQDYFTVMLRNVSALGPPGADTLMGTADDESLIHDQAAQLTAIFIDFADYDGGIAGGGALNPGGPADLPTKVQARRLNGPTGPTFYGIEKQPYISEVYWSGTQLAVELTNPHNVPIDLAPSSASGVGLPYRIDYSDGTGTTTLVPFQANVKNIIQAGNNRYVYVANNYGGLPAANQSSNFLTLPPAAPTSDDSIRLVRVINGVTVICDEVLIPPAGVSPAVQQGDFDPAAIPWTLQRDNSPNNAGGWRVTVPRYSANDGVLHTLGGPITVQLPDVAPVHATTDDRGLESAYPTTGSMLLLMLNANSATAPATAARVPGTANPFANPAAVDNGHMPVFADIPEWATATGLPPDNDDPPPPLEPIDEDQDGRFNELGNLAQFLPYNAQPLDGSTLLSIPWGQLVFDYFTALPFENRFDPTATPPTVARPVEPGNLGEANIDDGFDEDGDGVVDDAGYAGWLSYLRANQPTVELGYRVAGRININAAPWKVLQGLPFMPPTVLPIYKQFDPWFTQQDGTLAEWSGLYGGAVAMGEYAPPFTTPGAGSYAEQLGAAKAQGIVAYRELREISDDPVAPTWSTGNYNFLSAGARARSDQSDGLIPSTSQRHTAGFLTVGELASVGNAQLNGSNGSYEMDNGQNHGADKNYLLAVAPLVALGDWVTVKGHTFTAYGVVTGHGAVDQVRDKAQRFEVVYDRSNILISNDPDERPNIVYKVREPLSELSR